MKKVILLSLLVLFSITSCMSFKASDLAVLQKQESMILLGHFDSEVLVSEFLGKSGGTNLFNISAEVMNEKLSVLVWNEIIKKGGNGAINLNIEYKATFLDLLANYLTTGIWAPSHLRVSGDVIKFSDDRIGQINTEESLSVAVIDLN